MLFFGRNIKQVRNKKDRKITKFVISINVQQCTRCNGIGKLAHEEIL
jgi:hypothetical protein